MELTTEHEFTRHVARALGLSESLGPEFIRRAFQDAGMEVDTPTPQQLREVMPHIEARLSAFIGTRDARDRMQKLRAFLASIKKPSRDPATMEDADLKKN